MPGYGSRVDSAAQLADYRLRVARLHLADGGLDEFRRGRDELFREHPQSPLSQEQRAGFEGLPYFPHDPGAAIEAPLEAAENGDPLEIDTGGKDGVMRYTRAGRLETPFGKLTLFWLEGYGGGLFLPFRDATSGEDTYGGGRYLTDTIKGTFGRGVSVDPGGGRTKLDFNYAYNPSCAYNSSWMCPLAPPENRLDEPVRAGELAFPGAV